MSYDKESIQLYLEKIELLRRQLCHDHNHGNTHSVSTVDCGNTAPKTVPKSVSFCDSLTDLHAYTHRTGSTDFPQIIHDEEGRSIVMSGQHHHSQRVTDGQCERQTSPLGYREGDECDTVQENRRTAAISHSAETVPDARERFRVCPSAAQDGCKIRSTEKENRSYVPSKQAKAPKPSEVSRYRSQAEGIALSSHTPVRSRSRGSKTDGRNFIRENIMRIQSSKPASSLKEEVNVKSASDARIRSLAAAYSTRRSSCSRAKAVSHLSSPADAGGAENLLCSSTLGNSEGCPLTTTSRTTLSYSPSLSLRDVGTLLYSPNASAVAPQKVPTGLVLGEEEPAFSVQAEKVRVKEIKSKVYSTDIRLEQECSSLEALPKTDSLDYIISAIERMRT